MSYEISTPIWCQTTLSGNTEDLPRHRTTAQTLGERADRNITVTVSRKSGMSKNKIYGTLIFLLGLGYNHEGYPCASLEFCVSGMVLIFLAHTRTSAHNKVFLCPSPSIYREQKPSFSKTFPRVPPSRDLCCCS